jgi:hypothetical protein
MDNLTLNRDVASLETMRTAKVGTICQIRNLSRSHKLRFAWNADDVTPIKNDYAQASAYDCFYYELNPKGDNYCQIWGLVGQIATDNKQVTKIL